MYWWEWQLLHLVLILLTMSSTVFCVYQIPLVKVESERVQMLREGKWSAHLRQMHSQRLHSHKIMAKKEVYTDNVNNYYDSEYIVNVSVGTPRQTFRVALDTTTADFWIVDQTCSPRDPDVCDESICDAGLICDVFCPDQVCCTKKRGIHVLKTHPCRGRHYFDSKKSFTYVATPGKWRSNGDMFGNFTAQGFYGNDTIRFGNVDTTQLVVPGVIFGQATAIDQNFIGHHTDGVLGLAFPSLSQLRGEPPVERAVKLGLINPLFTVYLKHAGGRANDVFGGAITYGGTDLQHCDKAIAYQNLTLATFWQFKMESISVGKFYATRSWDVISDTHSSVIRAPIGIAQKIAEEFGAEYSIEDDTYYVNCNANVKFSLGFPTSKEKYTIDSANLVIEIKEDRCILAISGFRSLFWGPQWILGVPFIRQYCNVYDILHKRIGFAKSL